jgi:hypothetical protein
MIHNCFYTTTFLNKINLQRGEADNAEDETVSYINNIAQHDGYK